MIKTYAYDVEVLPNFYSITFVDVSDYLNTFRDACNISIKKGKEVRDPIPLVQKYTVKEIIEKLENVKQYKFYIHAEDDSQLLQMIGFINEMRLHRNEKGVAVRTDCFGYNSNGYDRYMIAALLMFFNTTNTTAELITKLYETSKHIIDIQNNPEVARHDFLLTNLKKFNLPFTNIDIMTIFGLNKCGATDENGDTVYFPKSLKQTSINLQWYQLLEYELPPITNKDVHYYHKILKYKGLPAEGLNQLVSTWDRYILLVWIPPMMHYNTNDVFIVCEMIRLYIDEIKLRYNLSSVYEVDVLSSSRSNIADKLFIKFYSDFSNLDPSVWRGKKTERTCMSLNKVIFPFIKFKTEELQLVLEDMKRLKLYSIGKEGLSDAIFAAYKDNILKSPIKDKAEKLDRINENIRSGRTKGKIQSLKGIELKINNLEYTIATGGLHSKDIPRELKSKIILKDKDEKINWDNLDDNAFVYVHYDIASFYPSLMVAYNIAPAHMNEGVFVKLVRWLRDTRVQAKHSNEDYIDGIPKDLLAQALKIVINSIYGKLGYELGDIYDRLAVLKVTINGQLMVIMLCEELELNDIEVVSANTDGIVVKLYKKDKNKFEQIANKWLEQTKLEADSEEFKCYINRDINNYIAQELNGKVTHKGVLNPKMYMADLTKGYNMPIVAEAVSKFFLEGKPVLDTLYEATNILDFCKTQNINRKFAAIYTINGKTEVIQRNNRYYVSNIGGTLEKVEKADASADCYVIDNKVTNTTGVKSNLCAGYNVTILNTLDDKDIMFRNINYQYYLNEANKIIDPIKLSISAKTKGDRNKGTKSGKQLIKKYSGMHNSLFDDC